MSTTFTLNPEVRLHHALIYIDKLKAQNKALGDELIKLRNEENQLNIDGEIITVEQVRKLRVERNNAIDEVCRLSNWLHAKDKMSDIQEKIKLLEPILDKIQSAMSPTAVEQVQP